jgi:hypothetical protein
MGASLKTIRDAILQNQDDIEAIFIGIVQMLVENNELSTEQHRWAKQCLLFFKRHQIICPMALEGYEDDLAARTTHLLRRSNGWTSEENRWFAICSTVLEMHAGHTANHLADEFISRLG